jgi:hypothetical protein
MKIISLLSVLLRTSNHLGSVFFCYCIISYYQLLFSVTYKATIDIFIDGYSVGIKKNPGVYIEVEDFEAIKISSSSTPKKNQHYYIQSYYCYFLGLTLFHSWIFYFRLQFLDIDIICTSERAKKIYWEKSSHSTAAICLAASQRLKKVIVEHKNRDLQV